MTATAVPPGTHNTHGRANPRAFHHNPRETAQYVADIVLELRNMAKSEGFATLQGLLEVTYYEAFSVAHKMDLPEGELELLERISQDAMKA